MTKEMEFQNGLNIALSGYKTFQKAVVTELGGVMCVLVFDKRMKRPIGAVSLDFWKVHNVVSEIENMISSLTDETAKTMRNIEEQCEKYGWD